MEEENHTDGEPAIAEESLMDITPAMSDKETVVTEILEVPNRDIAVGKPKITPRYLSGSVGSCHDYCKYGKKCEDEVIKPWKSARKKPVAVRSEDKSAPEDTESKSVGNHSAEPKREIAGRKRSSKNDAGDSSNEHSSKKGSIRKTDDSPKGSVKKVSKVNPKARKSTQNKKPGSLSFVDDVPEKTVYVVESSVNEKGREDNQDDIQQGPSASASSSGNKIARCGNKDVDVRKRPPFLPPGTRIRPVRLLSKSRSIGRRSSLKKDKQMNSENGLENSEAVNKTKTKKAGFLSRSFSRRSALSRHKQSNSQNGLEVSKDGNKTDAKKTGFLFKSRSVDRRFGLSRHKQNNSGNGLEDSNAENKTSAKTAEVKLTTAIQKKLSFSRSKSISLQRQDSLLRRLRFRKRILDEDSNGQGDGLRKTLIHREDGGGKTDGYEAKREKVVLRHREVEGKKKKQTLFNNVIEETAKKLAQVRKSKVKALVGAFETVISLQDRQPSIRLRRRSSVKVKALSHIGAW